MAIYPDEEDRALALLAEGTEIYDKIYFREGTPLQKVVITSHPEKGYLVSTYDAEALKEST